MFRFVILLTVCAFAVPAEAVAQLLQPVAKDLLVMVGERQGKALMNGVWMDPDAVASLNRDDALLREYRELRSVMPDTLDGQTELAGWCHLNNLSPQRDAHLKRALIHDPENA